MGWAERVGEGQGRNQKPSVSSAGKVLSGGKVTASDGTRYVMTRSGSLRRNPRRLRGKANVKAAKRARTYENGVRVIKIVA